MFSASVAAVSQQIAHKYAPYFFQSVAPTWDALAPALVRSLQQQGYFSSAWNTGSGSSVPGTATVGLYRVNYDYDPKTQKVSRRISLVSAGGNWGNEEGAANVMMETARKQALEMEHKSQQQNAKLPSLNDIRGSSPTPKPPPAATLPPI